MSFVKKEVMKGHLTLRSRADPPTFQAIRKLIAQIVLVSGGSARDALELEVATGEVLANAYQHAYRRTHGPVEIDLIFDDQKVEISIHDDGAVRIDALNIPRALPGGCGHHGLYLVKKMTDFAEIVHPRTTRGGTTVRMIKYISVTSRLTRILGIDADLGWVR
jgi:anti-sigma regulatory factor (Ser/Thr protein kinase)